jgi:hypothetical protein
MGCIEASGELTGWVDYDLEQETSRDEYSAGGAESFRFDMGDAVEEKVRQDTAASNKGAG